MNKIWLIIEREYLTRVRKKSFLVMSILGPLLIAAFYGIIIWSTVSSGSDKRILVVDESSYFKGKFADAEKLSFVYGVDSLDATIASLGNSAYDAVLYIPKFDLENPTGFQVYSVQTISPSTESSIRKTIEKEIEGLRLENRGVDVSLLKEVKTRVKLETKLRDKDGKEKDSNTLASTIIGIISGIVIYMFIFLYGVQVMRGVLEEKISRIVEVIISSVKPFQLMLGKIIGIAGVGLTQILIWIVLGSVITFVSTIFFADQLAAMEGAQSFSQNGVAVAGATGGKFAEFTKALGTINTPLILSSFVFYFLFGYLMYGALFAAIGSAVDSETDTQQFMLPITIPLIMSIALSGVILNEPYGDLAFWFSLFPLTSPVVMMIRLPFIGMSWELILSMFLLILSFLACTWVAGRIYRVGILMYGKKPSFKELSKWLFYKG